MKRVVVIPVFLLVAAMVGTVPGLFAQSSPPLPIALANPGPIGAATTTAIFSHMAFGGGYSTVFTLINTGTGAVTGNLILTGQNGAALNADLSSSDSSIHPVTNADSIALNIPEGGTTFVTATPVSSGDPTKAGWAQVQSSGGTLGGVSTFQLTSGGKLQTIAGVLTSSAVSSATIPVNDDATHFTGFAVSNPSNTSITIKLVEVDGNGTPAATPTPITLGPAAQTATFLLEVAGALPNFKGSLVLIGENSATFTVVALVEAQPAPGVALFTAIPVIPSKAPNIN